MTVLLTIVGNVVICGMLIAYGAKVLSEERNQVYVLDGDIPFLAQRSQEEANFVMEAKAHIQLFHQYFFTLPPDDDYIKWIDENPNGFVLNIDQTKDPSKIYKDYPKIHFANCGQLNKRPGRTTGKYFKVCSNSIEELE